MTTTTVLVDEETTQFEHVSHRMKVSMVTRDDAGNLQVDGTMHGSSVSFVLIGGYWVETGSPFHLDYLAGA